MRSQIVPLALAGVAALALGLWFVARPDLRQAPDAGLSFEILEVRVPDLSEAARRGQAIFAAACSECHGPTSGGIEGRGPPLAHPLYDSGHHSRERFSRVVNEGVAQHHWSFGDMAAIEGLSAAEISDLYDFVHEVRAANRRR